jgi:predicted ATPase
MYISRLRLSSYGSFADSGDILLGSGINFLVGENNAGKSQVLRSLASAFPDDRHRSAKEHKAQRLARSHEEIDLVYTGREFADAWLRAAEPLYWPVPKDPDGPQKAVAMASRYVESDRQMIRLARSGGNDNYDALDTPSHGEFVGYNNRAYHLAITVDGITTSGGTSGDNLLIVARHMLRDKLFLFDAQRFSLGTYQLGFAERLDGNASNLAAVLSRLQGEQGTLFRQLVDHLRTMFSSVGNLSVVPTRDGRFEIRVWPEEEQRYLELSAPLDRCGTGISQAIAILAVAMTMESAVIVIDEISSFLHPAASKALLRILQTHYDDHQYIVSTHSSDVINSCSPDRVYLIRKIGYESQVQLVDLTNLTQLRAIAGQLGVSMTDVFAAERVIWVEGQTEELCFPYLFSATVGPVPRGTLFASIVATGDFMKGGARPTLIFDIYDRLTAAAGPLVQSAVFAFDGERLSEEKKADIRKRARGRVAFLPRRNFECFLLHASAISSFICGKVGELDPESVEDDVRRCLDESGGDARFGAKTYWTRGPMGREWMVHVDGAKLISHICSQVTENRLHFRKGTDSLAILKLLLARDRGHLSELVQYVEGLVEATAFQ